MRIKLKHFRESKNRGLIAETEPPQQRSSASFHSVVAFTTNSWASMILEGEESSSAGESHPHALPEPDVNLSIHPALIAQPSVASPFANGQIDWVPSLQCALTNRPPSVRGA